jgi:hypothetical protein
MCCSVIGCVVPDISEVCISFIFMVKESMECNFFLELCYPFRGHGVLAQKCCVTSQKSFIFYVVPFS